MQAPTSLDVADSKPAPSKRFVRAHRLLTEADYELVQRKGKRGSTTHVAVRWLPQNASQPLVSGARLGLVVGKKLLKRAVDRNAFKRQAREAFRQSVLLSQPIDIVFRLALWDKKGSKLRGGAAKRAIRLELQQQLTQINETLNNKRVQQQ
jgi:ribonuclease P protein component